MLWPLATGTELTGDVVTLRRAEPERDAGQLFHVLDHDAVWAHIDGRPRNPRQFEDILDRWNARDDWTTWGVWLRASYPRHATDTLVGITSYLDVSVPDARLEIGATLYTPTVWGGPVNPEAKLLLLQHAFDRLHVGRVQLKTDVRNSRSQQAISRLGAKYEGTLRRHQRRSDGSVRDSVLFSITAEDWPDVRSGLTARLAQSIPPGAPERSV